MSCLLTPPFCFQTNNEIKSIINKSICIEVLFIKYIYIYIKMLIYLHLKEKDPTPNKTKGYTLPLSLVISIPCFANGLRKNRVPSHDPWCNKSNSVSIYIGCLVIKKKTAN
jgi:hypothetical protein